MDKLEPKEPERRSRPNKRDESRKDELIEELVRKDKAKGRMQAVYIRKASCDRIGMAQTCRPV